MTEEMINLYKKLNTNDKRNELSSLIIKLDKLVDELIKEKKVNNKFGLVKNYNTKTQILESEDDLLLFFYEDIWTIKNKILLLSSASYKDK